MRHRTPTAASGPGPRAAPRGAERGLGLVEVLVAVAMAALALLGHATSILRGHRYSQSEQERTLGLQTVRGFVERMRDDDDWAGLYARLSARLDTRGGWHLLSDHYPDLVAPARLGTTTVRIEVPRSAAVDPDADPGLFLREDRNDVAFGLPYDLDGDGHVTSDPVDANYLILPMIVRLRWTAPGQVQQEIRLSTWLRGERP